MRKQFSTRIDLTPMVDLGFLLITFFIFTTTLMEPSVVKLNLPEDGPLTPTGEHKTLTLLLCKNNTVGYYAGADAQNLKFTNYSPSGIRSAIQAMQETVNRQFGDRSQLLVVIKPMPESSYKNMVEVLDEMHINDVKRYVLTEANEQEIVQMGKEYN